MKNNKIFSILFSLLLISCSSSYAQKFEIAYEKLPVGQQHLPTMLYVYCPNESTPRNYDIPKANWQTTTTSNMEYNQFSAPGDLTGCTNMQIKAEQQLIDCAAASSMSSQLTVHYNPGNQRCVYITP